MKGYAKLNSTTQYFLDTCPAVQSWTSTMDENWAEFDFDPAVEIGIMPPHVYFITNGSEDDRAAYASSLLYHEIDRLDESDLEGTAAEKAALHEILAAEGFGGREDNVATFDAARHVAIERLAWYRTTRILD